jgi:hypothetical protein
MSIRQHPDVLHFQNAARKFCELVETRPEECEQWLHDILAAVARLYACGCILPSFYIDDKAPDCPPSLDVNDEEWKRVYMYRDVKPGLRAWDTGDDALLSTVILNWKLPLFGLHWGLHAVSAMRALHPLAHLRVFEPHPRED